MPERRPPFPPPSIADGLPPPRRHGAVVALLIVLAMSVLDSSIANLALPSIARDLGAEPTSTVWVVNGYQIAVIITLLPVAALGERFGYRRIYIGGLLLFTAASLGCALSNSLDMLVSSRFAQGLGAGAMMAINGALMRFTYPKAGLGRGIGYNALVIAGTATAGPAVAAAILSLGTWHWLFLVNVPLGLFSLILGLRFLPRPQPNARSFDILSALLNAAAFGALFLVLSDLASGPPSPRLALTIPLAIIAGAVLVRRARASARPLIPLDLIQVPVLRLAYGASLCAFAAQMCLLVALPFHLEARFGLAPATIGLLIVPMALGVAITSQLANRLQETRRTGVVGAAGMIAMAAGLILLAAAPAGLPVLPGIATGMGLCGLGFGLFQTPNNHVMLKSAPLDRAGAAAGMLSMSRLLGQTGGALLAAAALRFSDPASVTALLVAAVFAAGAAGLCAQSRTATS